MSEAIESPAKEAAGTIATQRPASLRDCVQHALTNYFAKLEGQTPADLYDMVIAEIEAPLFEIVMDHTRGNQSKAAILLGISRGTLRKKLKIYGIIE